MSVTAKEVLDVARSWLGYSEANGKFKQILDVYNSHKPLARGYVIKTTDEWCDAFVSACAIKAGAADLIGTEVGCEKHIQIFKNKKIWIEDGNVKPQAGDIIVFNWDDNTQSNDGGADHIGFVEQVAGDIITCIEGNMNETVARRTIPVGWGYIRGFARPKYSTSIEEDDDMNVDRFRELWLEMRKTLQDNDANNYSKEAREWAVSNGLIIGNNTDEFNGMWEDVLTREQLVTVLYRFFTMINKN